MKAWQITKHEEPIKALEHKQVDIPQPGPHDVQIKVEVAGIGLPDVLMCRGKYAFSPQMPFIPGQEVAGVITAVGSESTAVVGARVMAVAAFYSGNGSFAEYCLAPEFALYRMPEAMSNAEAAIFCIPYHTAFIAFEYRAQLTAGESVLIHGAGGGSGSAAIQLAKAMGATVIATANSEEKLAYCCELGADYVVSSQTEVFVEKVMEVTNGQGVDVVFDPVGGDIFEQSLACCANGARLLAVGFASGEWGAIDTYPLVLKNCSLMGVYVGSYSREQMLACHERLIAFYEAGKINSQLEALVDFGSLPDALQRLAKRQVHGKLAVRCCIN